MAKTAGFFIGLAVLGVSAAMVAAADLDLDAPIATARYGDEPVSLASGPPDETPTAPPASVAPAAAALDEIIHLHVALNDITPERIAAAFSPASLPTPPSAAAPQAFAPRAAPARERRTAMVDGEALLKRLSPKPNDLAKDRWIAYLAGSDTAVGLNLVRDSVQGFRRAGWSVEDIAEYGKAQLGFGWRRKHTQVSLAATHREWSKIGQTRRDVVFGVNVSVKRGER